METVSASVFAVTALSLVFSVLAPFVVKPLSSMLTPSPVLAAMVEEYLFLFMLLIPFLNLCILISYVVTVDNHPKLGAADLLDPAGFIGPDDRFTDLGGTLDGFCISACADEPIGRVRLI